MKNLLSPFIAVVLFVFPAIVRADLTPESVAVVVNGDSWASVTIANEYVRLRNIPESNVIVLHNISSFERMSVDTFRDEILRPVFDTLDERGLRSQIDCVTYSVDLPTSVNVKPDVKEQKLPQVITPVASTNGLTYLHEWVMKEDINYLRLSINKYSRRTLPIPIGNSLSPEEASEYQRGMALYAEKKYADATEVIEGVVRATLNNPSVYYNLACCQALSGKADAAMVSLGQAVALGWRDHKHIEGDTDLTTLRNRADFKALLEKMRSQRIEVQPTRGFRSTQAWNERGEPAQAGSRYMLSTMLGVTSGRGNSIAEVVACLRRAAGADGSAPRGTVYFLKNGNVRSTTREWAFADATDQLVSLGVRTETQDGVLPKNRDDVIGALIGTATFNWKSSQSTILPGAIVEHLTSCGGMMRERDTQTPCTDFIRAGAAGSSGAVTEPYALQAKFPNAFMHLHYARGSTLAEAFYQSLEGPYQLLIIGDPLCQPWGRDRRLRASGITPNASLNGTVEIKPRISRGKSLIDSFQLFVDGRLTHAVAPGESFMLDTTAYADGEHTITLVALRNNALETRDREMIGVRFENTGRTVQLITMPKTRVRFGEPIFVELNAKGASSLEVTHLGRVVGHLNGARGRIKIDTSRLGLGTVTLQPIARFEDDGAVSLVRGASFDLKVSPRNIPAKRGRRVTTTDAGLSISIDDGPLVPILDTLKPNWLADAGVTDGQTFALTGFFDVEKRDVMQIQLKTNTGAQVEIDGVAVAHATDGTWHYTPAQLSPGTHHLRVTGTAPAGRAKARLDLRLGTTGTRHPSDRWLRQDRTK